MTLRAKLALSSTMVLLVAIGVIGFIAVRSVESTLLAQKDEQLTSAFRRLAVVFPDGAGLPGRVTTVEDGFGDEGDNRSEDALTLRSDNASVLIGPDGEIVVAVRSGFHDEPDPLPDVSDLPDGTEPVSIPSVDGSLEYRAVAIPMPDGSPRAGSTLVWALPLDDVEEATAAIIRVMVVAGVLVLMIGGLATWWTVTRATRPVDEMVDTAEAIASGDLSRRVPALSPDTELGRLGGSLNGMLAHIEEAVGTEREGRERLRRFVTDASHELRTPLAIIAGYTELQRKGGIPPSQEQQAWAAIDREAARMGHLVDDLAMLTRLGQSQEVAHRDVDLSAVARDAVFDHRVVDPGRPASLASDEPVRVRGDDRRLHQVLANLLANARDHTPGGTIIHVSIERDCDEALVRVRDDGPGFPPDEVARVFERFYRGDPSRSRATGGSGLGLSIVEAIVVAHGGSVAADNHPDGGAVVEVRLPRSS